MPELSSPHLYSLLTRLHGHLGWLGLALMLHPVMSLGRPGRPTRSTRWSAWLAAAFVSTPFALGWLVYPTYRAKVKPALLVDAHRVAHHHRAPAEDLPGWPRGILNGLYRELLLRLALLRIRRLDAGSDMLHRVLYGADGGVPVAWAP